MDAPYRPTLPPAGLGEVLVCEWDATFSGPVDMVPDGCVELMWIEGRGVIVCGPEQRAWSAQHSQPVTAAGVRMRPGVAASMLRVGLDEITDTRISGEDLWGAAIGRRLDEQLSDQPRGQRSALLRKHLLPRLDEQRRFSASLVHAVASNVPVADLARDLALSERQLQRISRREFGYGLTRLRAILRLQRVMALALRRPGTSIADLAAHCGYADQAHLARDCAMIAGCTPSQLLASTAPHWHGEGSVLEMSDSSKPGGARPA